MLLLIANAEGGSHSVMKAAGVRSHLSLNDHRSIVLEDELDGILNGQYMSLSGVIDPFQHGRHGSRFSVAGGPGHQNQTSLHTSDVVDDGGKIQRLYF